MNITLIGYGKMGKEIEKTAREKNLKIENVFRSDSNLKNIKESENICVDFTNPDAFKNNYKNIADKFSGAVVGTTGWYDILDEVTAYFKSKNKKLVYATNFSLGVNLLFEIVDYSSKILSEFKEYDPYIIELHHKAKKDIPSGTAVTIKNLIKKHFSEINISSVRSGHIKGIHEIGFESEDDKISLKHEAYSRKGFALGAVTAAEWLNETDGIWNFRDLIKLKLNKK